MEEKSRHDMVNGKGIERRDFMKIALVAGAMTAVAALPGCAKTPSTDASGKTGLATPNKTIDADVVIVGSGIAGHAAAIEAAKAGAKVVVLEKMPKVGGNSAYADGICYPESEAAVKQIEAAESAMINYNVNTIMTADVLKHAVENCKWLEGFAPSPKAILLTGILKNAAAYTPSKPGEVGGGNMISFLKAAADKLGVQTMVSTPATGLLITNGAVNGVQATADDGTVINVNAKATIIATAGCAENTEMFTSANTWPANKFKYKGLPGHTGDGIRLAQSAGMGSIKNVTPMMIGHGISSQSIGSPLAAAAGMEPTNVWVNHDGVRFAQEHGWVCTNAIRMQADNFSIMDQAQFDRVVKTGCIIGMVMYVRAGVPQPGMQAEVDKLLAAKDPDVFKADTIEGLAKAMGVDPATLVATMKKYNEDCLAGVDTEFGKDKKALVPLTTAPFYAFRTTANFLVATGGVRCNAKLQVTTEDNKVIPGLWVAGMDASGYFDQTYPVAVAGGVGQQTALHTGRVTGKAAAAYAKA